MTDLFKPTNTQKVGALLVGEHPVFGLCIWHPASNSLVAPTFHVPMQFASVAEAKRCARELQDGLDWRDPPRGTCDSPHYRRLVEVSSRFAPFDDLEPDGDEDAAEEFSERIAGRR